MSGATEHQIAFWALFVVTLIGSLIMLAQDAEADVDVGAQTESVMSDGTSDYIGTYQYTGCGGRQMNGTLWKFRTYQNPADNTDRIIWGYFSNNDGDDWYKIKILDNTDPYFDAGEYPQYIFDVVMLSNNSIILAVSFSANGKEEAHVMCHWNNSDLSQWERVLVYGDYSVSDFGMGVNETDYILCAWEYYTGNGLKSCRFNADTRVSTNLGGLANRRNYLDKVYPFWNGTGWTISFQYEPGTGDRLYIYNKDYSTLIHEEPSIGSTQTIHDLVLTGDGTYVYVFTGDQGGWPSLRYWNETGSGARQYISAQAQWSKWSFEIALKNNDPTKIKIYAYYYVDDTFHEWAWLNYYDHINIFKNNHQKWFEETTDWGTGVNFVDWAPYKLYPRLWDPIHSVYVNTQLQNNGTWNLFSETDPDNDKDFWSTGPYPDMETRGYSIFPWIPFYTNPAPQITTVALDDGTIDVYYTFTMSATDGDLPYTWSLIVAPAWLDIGPANGTLYGIPTQTGTFDVKVRVRDDPGRTDDAEFSLKIISAVSEPEGEDWNINPDTFIGLLWVIFITLCVCVALIDKVQEISTKRRGG